MEIFKKRRVLIIVAAAMLAGFMLPKAYSAADQTYQQLRVLVEVMGYIKDSYVDPIDTKDLIYGAADGMVRKLDDFSQFMEPDVNKRVKSDTEGEFGGLGIRIAARDGFVTVITPMPGTPAYKAGILPGDKIVKINGEDAKDMLPDDAVKKLRGEPGTKVKLTIGRELEEKKGDDRWITKDFELERAKIVPEVVQYKMLESNIGYLRLTDFSGHATEEFTKALTDMKKQGMQAFVLDLRYNPGGLLTAAVDISKYFIGGNKMIVYTKGRAADSYQEFRAAAHAPYEDLPMVVLVNGGSASGSEIVAGAMQDNKRAVIIGTRTFGKASVQTIIPLSDGSGLRLTIARYYTPSGRSIHRNPKTGTGGISPDMEVKVSREDEIKVMEQFDKLFFPPTAEKAATQKTYSETFGKDKKDGQEKEYVDETLRRAVELLKAREAFSALKHG